MKIDVNMTTREEKFEVDNWWATGPEFVLHALHRQLVAAAAIWPELKKYRIGFLPTEDEKPSETMTATADDAAAASRDPSLGPSEQGER